MRLAEIFFGPRPSPPPPMPEVEPAGTGRNLDAEPKPATPVAVFDSAPTTRERSEPSRAWAWEHHPPEAHARALLAWLQTGDARGREGDILFDEMLEIYREMCVELGWAERCWKPVSTQFRLLTSGQKKYRNVIGTDGVTRKLRVYPVPGVSDRKLVALRNFSLGASDAHVVPEARLRGGSSARVTGAASQAAVPVSTPVAEPELQRSAA